MLAFGISLSVAYFLGWKPTDLVWSLWLCSLVLGYLTLLSAVGAGAYVGLFAVRQSDYKIKQLLPGILIGTVIGLFVLVFFSFHFCGFHAGHSVFLRQFFPLDGMPRDGFGAAFMNPPLLWMLAFKHLMRPYGLFLIPAIIAERRYVFAPLIKAISAVRTGIATMDSLADRTDGKPGRTRNPLSDAMARPYINVVRMHLLIFFFGICYALKVDSFFVYAVVYSVYFFPWSELKEVKLRAANKLDVSGA